MHSKLPLGFSDADHATLTGIVGAFEQADAALARAEVARIRALAAAGQLAQKQAAGSSARVRAHDMALRGIAAELAGAARLTDRSVQRQIDDARTLVEHYPRTLAARESSTITRQHVFAVVEAGAALPDDRRPEFDSRAVTLCLHDTANRVKGALEILAARLHPRNFEERHRDAREARAVRVIPIAEGMSELCATLPTVIAQGIHDRLTQMARTVIDQRSARGQHQLDEAATPTPTDHDFSADERTIDQVRADVFADLVLTSAPDADPTASADRPGTLGAIRAKVQVVVPALTLTGSDQGPVDLVGQAPIDAETARTLAGNTAWWECLVTHPVSGAVLHADGYQRPAALDRHLRARDQHCRFPGCRVAAIRCEVDHTQDYAKGGNTSAANLAHLCQRHHSMKQFTSWRVTQQAGGVLRWVSPIGRVYTDEPPPPIVQFAPAPAGTANAGASPAETSAAETSLAESAAAESAATEGAAENERGYPLMECPW